MKRLTTKEKVANRLLGIKEDFEIKEIFKHRGRTCVIVEAHFGAVIESHHNGYVQSIKNVKSRSYEKYASHIDTDELTFSGGLYEAYKEDRLKGKGFLGFDSGHSWNTQNLNSQTFGEVKKRTIKLCEEMIREGL